jgi:hypothetical protein
MQDKGGNSYVGPKHFAEMVARGGIGTGKTGLASNAKASVNGVQGTAPVNFNAGSVMTIKKYEKISKK